MKLEKWEIQKAKEIAELMENLDLSKSLGLEERLKRTKDFIKNVNSKEEKGLKSIDLENGINEIEMSDGDLKLYDKDGKLTIHIPKDGKKAVFYGKLEFNEAKVDNGSPYEESIKLLEKKKYLLSNERDIINCTYGDNPSEVRGYNKLIRHLDGLTYSIDLLKNSL